MHGTWCSYYDEAKMEGALMDVCNEAAGKVSRGLGRTHSVPPPSARLPSHSPIHQLVIWLRRNDGTLRKQAENWPDGKLTLVVWKQCLMDPRVGFSKKDVAVVMKNTQVDKIDGESWVDYKPIVEISVDILTKRLSSKMACGGKQRREREKEGRVGTGVRASRPYTVGRSPTPVA